jgi:hypothetical protein
MPDRSRSWELSAHATVRFIHFFCRETSALLFPLRDRRQTSAPLQGVTRRSGHPGRDAHTLARGRRKDIFVNVRIHGDGQLW